MVRRRSTVRVRQRACKIPEIFGDDMAAVAMVDRLIHHAELISLKGDSYRLRHRDLGPRPTRPGDTA
jgi:DNA replication protein DnaC